MTALLVLLHPFPADARFWEPVTSLLDPGVRVLAPDAPGFGGRPASRGWAIADWADEVAGAIAAEGGAAVVAGLSMGGYAALALAARHPEVVRGLLLADTRAEADDDTVRAGRSDAIAAIAADGLEVWLEGFLPRLLSPAPDPAARARLHEIASRQPPAAVRDALRALAARPDRRPGLAAIRVPTLVVVGADDVPTPVAAAEVMRDGIPGARMEVVPGAGHMTALERPDAFAAALGTLLADVAAT